MPHHTSHHEISGSHIHAVEQSGLLEYDNVLLGDKLITFCRITLPSEHGNYLLNDTI
jgi:hypothetical protein